MNELGLTDFESLQSDELVIEGLDVEGALAKTKVMGEKIIRRRRIVKIISVASSVLVVVLAVGAFALVAGASDNESNSVRTVDRVETTVVTTATTLPVTTVTTAPPATQPVVVPKDNSIRQFGNQSVCTPPAGIDQPNADGVMIGSTSPRVDRWDLSERQTYPVSKSGGKEVVLVAKASSSAPNGRYIDLSSGYSTSNGFANISTMAFTYCEPGMALFVDPSGSGYIVDVTTWTP